MKKPGVVTILILLQIICRGAVCFAQTESNNLPAVVIDYLSRQYGKDSFLVSKHQIQFDVQTTLENVLSRNYISGFTYFGKKGFSDSNNVLIKHVDDSLHALSTKLNNNCPFESNSVDSPFTKPYVVFCSSLCGNTLYAEVLAQFGIIHKNTGYDLYGKGKTYFFIIENNTLKEVYTGEIYFN